MTARKSYVRLTPVQVKQLSAEMDDEYLNFLRECGADKSGLKAHLFRALEVERRYGISRSTFYRLVDCIGVMNHGVKPSDEEMEWWDLFDNVILPEIGLDGYGIRYPEA